jgi:hypothetical protein
MKNILALILLVTTIQIKADENTKPFKFPVINQEEAPSEANPNPNPCKFQNLKLPENFSVFAAGEYAGKEIDFQIDQSGNQTGQIDVAVNSPSKPVVLMLGAYDPTIWNIGWSKGTRILAVYASGYHKQVIAGLPKQTPTFISTYDNKSGCEYFYIQSDKINALNPRSLALFNRKVDMVYLAKNGAVAVGLPITDRETLITSTDTPPSSYFDRTAPLAGQLGLDNAVKMGLLRKATNYDAEKWVNAQAKTLSYEDIPPVAGKGLPKPNKPKLYNAYVIIKPFTFPSGLYGAHSATFFIPKGVPIPKGDLGHSTIFDFNTLSCIGTSCEH